MDVDEKQAKQSVSYIDRQRQARARVKGGKRCANVLIFMGDFTSFGRGSSKKGPNN